MFPDLGGQGASFWWTGCAEYTGEDGIEPVRNLEDAETQQKESFAANPGPHCWWAPRTSTLIEGCSPRTNQTNQADGSGKRTGTCNFPGLLRGLCDGVASEHGHGPGARVLTLQVGNWRDASGTCGPETPRPGAAAPCRWQISSCQARAGESRAPCPALVLGRERKNTHRTNSIQLCAARRREHTAWDDRSSAPGGHRRCRQLEPPSKTANRWCGVGPAAVVLL